MNLVFIYGPPATGKLTVAKELEKLTGYKLFHNHMARDLASAVLSGGEKNDLFEKICLSVFEETSKTNIKGLIFTFVYGAKVDNLFVKSVKEIVEHNNGKVCFIQLFCDKQELFKRVVQDSRKEFKKVKDLKELENMMKEYDLLSPIPEIDSLIINNTFIEPENVALQIKEFYQL